MNIFCWSHLKLTDMINNIWGLKDFSLPRKGIKKRKYYLDRFNGIWERNDWSINWILFSYSALTTIHPNHVVYYDCLRRTWSYTRSKISLDSKVYFLKRFWAHLRRMISWIPALHRSSWQHPTQLYQMTVKQPFSV